MKFLFINKPFFIEPLGVMHISSSIKEDSHQTDLITTEEDLERKVKNFKPDFIGYSIMTGDQNFYDEINKKLKSNHKFFSIAGGPHPTFFPEMLENSSFDAICRGEGERAIQQLLGNSNSKNIPNFWFKYGDKIIKNSVRPLIDNLNNLSFPDREIVFKYPKINGGPIKHFIASRGCPFNCSYCFNESFSKLYNGKGKRVRFRSIENLLEEINNVISTSPTKFVYFQDDTFTLNRNWLKEFQKEYSSEIGLPFHCHVRPNTIDEEKIGFLKDAGCYSVHIAAESGDDRLRNDILNRGLTKEQIVNASKIIKKSGIKFMLQNIIGLPTGTLEDDLKTLELNIECEPDYAWVSIFQPYPKTKLGEFCREQKIYTGDFSDLSSSFFDSTKLNFSEEYKNQLSNLQKLFAVAVKNPNMYYSGLLREIIDIPHKITKERFSRFYKNFRKEGDKKLYGFYL